VDLVLCEHIKVAAFAFGASFSFPANINTDSESQSPVCFVCGCRHSKTRFAHLVSQASHQFCSSVFGRLKFHYLLIVNTGGLSTGVGTIAIGRYLPSGILAGARCFWETEVSGFSLPCSSFFPLVCWPHEWLLHTFLSWRFTIRY